MLKTWIIVLVVVSVKAQKRIFEDRLYTFVNQERTFFDSQRICQFRNAIIAPARTIAENNFLFSFRNNISRGNERIWIGGTDKNRTDNDYIWLDGSPLSFTNWSPGEPINAGGQEDCMVMEFEFVSMAGQWNDIDCNLFKKRFFCMQINHSQTTSRRIKTTSFASTTNTQTTSLISTTATETTSTQTTTIQSVGPGGRVTYSLNRVTLTPVTSNRLAEGIGIGFIIGGIVATIATIVVACLILRRIKSKSVSDLKDEVKYEEPVFSKSHSTVSFVRDTAMNDNRSNLYEGLENREPPQDFEYQQLEIYENVNKSSKKPKIPAKFVK